jgi:6-phosphogluconolactonase (cycloisomerase 2 family)
MRLPAVSFLAVLIASAAGCAVFGEFESDDPGFLERSGTFRGSFIAIADADMAATAYADGRLEPFQGAMDEARLFVDGTAKGRATASNSVVSWPQVADVSPDGRFLYVVETRGSPAPGQQRVNDAFEDLPRGRRLQVFSIQNSGLELAAQIEEAGVNLQSVEASADGRFLAVASEEDGAELVIIPLMNGLPSGAPRKMALSPPYRRDDAERRIRTLHIAPDAARIAVNVANRRVQFYQLNKDDGGIPEGATAEGDPVEGLGRRLAVGKWAPDGRHFFITDTNWADSQLHMLTQGPSTLSAIAPPADGDPATIVSRAKVGRSAEGFSVSRDGRFIATINMERTYLPELAALSFWNGRRLYSVSLIAFDPQTSVLKEIDRIFAAGVLPEDVVFDRNGENLAVAVFHRRKGADRQRGFIDFFSIRDGMLVAQGSTQPLMRGPHDLVALP